MNIGIIGAGKLGSALAIALNKTGFCICGVYSKNEQSSKLLCDKLDIERENSIEATVQNAEVVFLSVPDNAIDSIASKIAYCIDREVIEKKIFLHLSGALTSEVLKPLQDLGALTGSFHPIQTFADRDNGWQKLFHCFFGFEGCAEALKFVDTIADKLKGRVIPINKEQKSLYHAAACIISNYTVTLFHIMHQLLIKVGMEEDAATSAFLPLLQNTVDNIEMLGHKNALTGPISRGDYKVVAKHIDALKKEVPQFETVYRLLGRETVEIALQRGSLCKEDVERLINLLEV
ncbi:MAG: DUF2520 domain-containing protein [Clostridiaceae bacterium]|jgi:predicted short-subunit dehydrogenase-like oxidoreductase (DUF2520 family)|nr:DUF2520 domain-containing protein [Clostridiaceae bacterium]